MSVTSGWGRLTWGQANWNEATTLKTGWGAQAWSDGEWGELKDVTFFQQVYQITSSVGSVDVPDQIITPTGLSQYLVYLHKVKLLNTCCCRSGVSTNFCWFIIQIRQTQCWIVWCINISVGL